MKFFGQDHTEVDWDNVEFEYVVFTPKTPESSTRYLGTFEWGAKGIGFGVIDIVQDGDKTMFNTERMSKSFVKQMLNYWVENSKLDLDT